MLSNLTSVCSRIGRKPVIVFGLSGVAISISLFGLSRSYAVMLLFRCIAGGLNGNVAVIKASLGDLTDETNSTEAFALYGMTWTLGSIFGNALGGALSHPAQRFGWTGAVWSAYPFLLRTCRLMPTCQSKLTMPRTQHASQQACVP